MLDPPTPSRWNCFGRIRRHSLVGGDVLLGLGFEVLNV